MTVIAQDDHLTAGAWSACGLFMERSTILIFGKVTAVNEKIVCFHMSSFPRLLRKLIWETETENWNRHTCCSCQIFPKLNPRMFWLYFERRQIDSLKYVNCLWTPSFTFPFHLGQGTTRLFEFHFFRLVFKIACFSDWLPTVLDTRMKTWEVFPYENEITDPFLATSLLGLLYGFFRDLHWCRVPRHLIFPQDKGWEYAKSEKKNAQSEKKTIFGGCNLSRCRKKLGKNFSFRRDLDPCLLDTSSLEPTNLRSHTAIQLVEGSLIVNSLVPA